MLPAIAMPTTKPRRSALENLRRFPGPSGVLQNARGFVKRILPIANAKNFTPALKHVKLNLRQYKLTQ